MSEVWAPTEQEKAQREIHMNLTDRIQNVLRMWEKSHCKNSFLLELDMPKKSVRKQPVWT